MSLVDQGRSRRLHLLLVEELDLAILDRMLPRLDGLSVVRRARAGKLKRRCCC